MLSRLVTTTKLRPIEFRIKHLPHQTETALTNDQYQTIPNLYAVKHDTVQPSERMTVAQFPLLLQTTKFPAINY